MDSSLMFRGVVFVFFGKTIITTHNNPPTRDRRTSQGLNDGATTATTKTIVPPFYTVFALSDALPSVTTFYRRVSRPRGHDYVFRILARAYAIVTVLRISYPATLPMWHARTHALAKTIRTLHVNRLYSPEHTLIWPRVTASVDDLQNSNRDRRSHFYRSYVYSRAHGVFKRRSNHDVVFTMKFYCHNYYFFLFS
jgi:hypothetical protein